VAALVLDEISFKTKKHVVAKTNINDKGPIWNKDLAILNVHAPNNRAIQQTGKDWELKGKIDKQNIEVGNFIILFWHSY
jgi:hypothetical protein